VQEPIRADRERSDGGRRLAAALSLIPPNILPPSAELERVADQHADERERARRIFITGLCAVEQALARCQDLHTRGEAVTDAEATLATVRTALRKLATRGAHPAPSRTRSTGPGGRGPHAHRATGTSNTSPGAPSIN
jgi:hypothetical protein